MQFLGFGLPDFGEITGLPVIDPTCPRGSSATSPAAPVKPPRAEPVIPVKQPPVPVKPPRAEPVKVYCAAVAFTR